MNQNFHVNGNNVNYEMYNNYESTDCNPLIGGRVNDYFANILNQPEPPRQYSVISKSEYTWSKFYHDYIEHNMLFIIIIIGFVLFLVIRYYTMDYDEKDDDTDLTNLTDDTDDSSDSKLNSKTKKRYKSKLKKYKKELDDEKKNILKVIDELSSINYEERKYYSSMEHDYNQQMHKLRELQKNQEMQDLEDIQQLKELQEQIASGELNIEPVKKQAVQKKPEPKMQVQSRKFKEPDRHPLDLTIKNNDSDDSDDDSNFYQIKKYNKKNKDDFISDMYIEPPYN